MKICASYRQRNSFTTERETKYPFLFGQFILTTAEFYDSSMARLGHEFMAIGSKTSFALNVGLF